MTRRILWIGVAAVAAILVAAAIVAGPLLPGLRGTTTNGPAPEQATSISVPVWTVGDQWKYNVSVSASYGDIAYDMAPKVVVAAVTLRVKEIVDVGAGTSAYNVTLTGESPMGVAMPGLGLAQSELTAKFGDYGIRMRTWRFEGYTWYRTSDLARLVDVRVVHHEAQIVGDHYTASIVVMVRTETVYDPAWDPWAFPIDQGETWLVQSHAVTQGTIFYRAEFDQGYVEIGKSFSFETPILYTMMSDGFEDITTEAGTFHAIKTSAALPAYALPVGDRPDESMMTELTNPMPRGSAEAWFSADVGNVVRARLSAGVEHSVAWEIELVSFERA